MPNDSASGGYLAPTGSEPTHDLDLDVVFQRVVANITGLPGPMVRPRVQPTDAGGAPIQKIPDATENWCAIGVTDETPDNDPYIHHDGRNDGVDRFQRYYAVEVLASFYGPCSGANAIALTDGIYVSQNREVLQLLGIGFVDVGLARGVPDLPNVAPRRRKDVVLRFQRRVERTYPIRNLTSAAGAVQAEDVSEPWSTSP